MQLKKTVTESGIADQMRLTELILNDQDFFPKLMELFRICEDLENMFYVYFPKFVYCLIV
ncbi:hypothetical protein ES288_A07G226600v1 [Gossypium darwinii]|nr:hypothetical protein ES288_A07G226600v1 [Gossypium darwinii]